MRFVEKLFGTGTASIYAIFIGASMLGMWSLFLYAGQVPQLASQPVAISLHMTAEFLTALALLIGGYGLLANRKWGRQIYFVSMGMLLYSAIQASGYFAEQGKVVLVAMFAVIAILTTIFTGSAVYQNEIPCSKTH